MSNYQYGDARYGALYEQVLSGSLTFNSSYSSLIGKGFRLYGAGNVSYILIPSANGDFDGILLTSGDYKDFFGDHTKNGLQGGAIREAGFYKNAKVVDYGDGTYDIQDFEFAENHIATIPLQGMTVDQFLSTLASKGNTYNPINLFKELLKTDNWVSGDNQGESTVVDGFDGNDEFYISTSAQFARGGAGNDVFNGTPSGAAILDGGPGDDIFDGSSGVSDRSKQYLWVGGSGANLYRGPDLNTIVVIKQKTSGQSADIIAYADLVLARPSQKTGYVVISTTNPDVNQLDLRFVDQPLLDSSGKKIAESGYFSVLYKGVEQVKINPMSGGWSLDGFIAEKDTYENSIRAAIAVASMEQLIVPSNYSTTALQEITKEYNLSAIPAKSSVDLRGQTLLDKSSYVSIADRFYLTEIKQNKNTGKLELIFNQNVGNIGSATIYELDSAGRPIKQVFFESQIKDGNKIVTSISNTGDKQYIAILTSRWTSATGISLEGQGTYGSSGVQTYQFTFGKDTVKPTIKNVSTNGTTEIIVTFSENIEFANAALSSQIGYLSRTKTPTQMSDIAYTFTVKDGTIKGDTLTLKLDKSLDGDLYFLPLQIKDPTGNYYSGNWNNEARMLSFEDPVAAANRIQINREKDNSFILPIKINWSMPPQGRFYHDGSSIGFVWSIEGSSRNSVSDYFYPFQDYSAYLYTSGKPYTPLQITLSDFTAEGVHKLKEINVASVDGQYVRYDTPEKLNQKLSEWGLERGSLDINVVGKPASMHAEVQRISMEEAILDMSDPESTIYGSLSLNVLTGDAYHDAAAKLSGIKLDYETPRDQWGNTDTLSIYLSEYERELVNLNPGTAIFRIDTQDITYSRYLPGEYTLTNIELTWDYPNYYTKIISADQAITLGLPKILTLRNQKPEKLIRQRRKLISLSFPGSKTIQIDGQDSLISVVALVEVSDFNPTLESYLDERISLDFSNQAFTEANANSSYQLYKDWVGSLDSRIVPVSYQYNAKTKKALVHFQGYVKASKNQFNGDWTLSNVNLSGKYQENIADSTALSGDSLVPFATTLKVSGGRQKSAVSSLALNDVDAPILAPLSNSKNALKVNLDTSASKEVSLSIYVTEIGVDEQVDKANSLSDVYSKILGFADKSGDDYLSGWFVLESPSGFSSKVVPIYSSDRVKPEQHWKDSYPDISKYQPVVSFDRNDEPGQWRLTQFIKFHPNNQYIGENDFGDHIIFASTSDYRDGAPSSITTEVLASRLQTQPHNIVLDVVNSGFDRDSLKESFQVNPRVSRLSLDFAEAELLIQGKQKVRLEIQSDYRFSGKYSPTFYGFNVVLSHQSQHIQSFSVSDLLIRLRSQNVISEIKLSGGLYKTTFEAVFELPDTLFGGVYYVRDIALQRHALGGIYSPQFARYDSAYDSEPLVSAHSLRSSKSLHDIDHTIVPAYTETTKQFLHRQFLAYESGLDQSALPGFTVKGRNPDDSMLNPIHASLHAIVLSQAVDIKNHGASFKLSLPSGYKQLFLNSRSSSFLSSDAFAYADATDDLWLRLVNKSSGDSFLAKATFAVSDQVASRYIYDVHVPNSVGSGDYRIVSIGPEGYFTSLQASYRDGLSNAENSYLDEMYGPDSSVIIANASQSIKSIYLNAISFSEPPIPQSGADGAKTVESFTSAGLKDGQEELFLVGSKPIQAIGNDLNNTLKGNAADNVLDGRGGADAMAGGKGNDTYIVDHAKDVVIEGSGAGTDTVKASVSYRLGNHVERLILTGNKAINGTGNGLNNRLNGNSAKNVLNGLGGSDIIIGGKGSDKLIGSSGVDKFIYQSIKDSGIGKSKRDVITDFNGKSKEKIDLSAIDAYTKSRGNQSFAYIGSKSFSGKRGEVRFSKGLLQVNTGSDRRADMEIGLTGVSLFQASYLIL